MNPKPQMQKYLERELIFYLLALEQPANNCSDENHLNSTISIFNFIITSA